MIMNKNVKGLIWTAGAIVLGIVVAGIVQKQIAKKTASADEE